MASNTEKKPGFWKKLFMCGGESRTVAQPVSTKETAPPETHPNKDATTAAPATDTNKDNTAAPVATSTKEVPKTISTKEAPATTSTKEIPKTTSTKEVPAAPASTSMKEVHHAVPSTKDLLIHKDFASAVRDRRTVYNIDKHIKVSEQRIEELVDYAVRWTPSSFNSQTSRTIILLGKHHDNFWNTTREILRKIVPAENFAPTDAKMTSFANGYGTILFFEDMTTVKKLQEQFASYADNFPIWSHHSSGMLQFVVWASLEAEGLGCSLQHYSPLVDEAVQKEWGAPDTWKLIAQMPFGHPVEMPGPKEFHPLEDRVKLYKE